MNLSGGAVAQALANAAGPALQAECNKKAPIAAGEIVVTGAGKISKCQWIIHINCPGYDRSPGGPAEDVSYVQKVHIIYSGLRPFLLLQL